MKKKPSSLESVDMIFSLCWDKKVEMLLAIWKLVFTYIYLKCLNIFQHPFTKTPMWTFLFFNRTCKSEWLGGRIEGKWIAGIRPFITYSISLHLTCEGVLSPSWSHTRVLLTQNKVPGEITQFARLPNPYLPNILQHSWLRLQCKGWPS